MQPKVDHLAFVVKELDRSVKFYQDVFDGEVGRSRGFNEKDQKAGRPVHTLVKVGDYGFDLFVEDPKNPPKPDARFLHFAFSIQPEEIDQALERLRRLNIPYDGPKVHGGSTSISIYFSDPDGYQKPRTPSARCPHSKVGGQRLPVQEASCNGTSREEPSRVSWPSG